MTDSAVGPPKSVNLVTGLPIPLAFEVETPLDGVVAVHVGSVEVAPGEAARIDRCLLERVQIGEVTTMGWRDRLDVRTAEHYTENLVLVGRIRSGRVAQRRRGMPPFRSAYRPVAGG